MVTVHRNCPERGEERRMIGNESTLRRRTVLKTIGGTAVGLTVGTGVVAGNDNEENRGGGVGYLTSVTGDLFDVDGDPSAFTMGGERRFTMVRSPDCDGNGEEKEFQGYFIWREDDGTQGTLYVEPERNVPSDGDTHVFHNVRRCSEAKTLEDGDPHRDWDYTWRVNFRPE